MPAKVDDQVASRKLRALGALIGKEELSVRRVHCPQRPVVRLRRLLSTHHDREVTQKRIGAFIREGWLAGRTVAGKVHVCPKAAPDASTVEREQ